MKNILLFGLVAIAFIAIFGDGGFEVNPELSNDMNANFEYQRNTYNIEKWIENNYAEDQNQKPDYSATALPAKVVNGVDIYATALPVEAAEAAAFNVSEFNDLTVWANQNNVQTPPTWNNWEDDTKYEWLKLEKSRRKR